VSAVSYRASTLMRMSSPVCLCGRRASAVVDAEIRALVARTGDEWTPEALGELARLRAEWCEAEARERLGQAA
jgi:hypothetical protein